VLVVEALKRLADPRAAGPVARLGGGSLDRQVGLAAA
jgi:hypothetical protein